MGHGSGLPWRILTPPYQNATELDGAEKEKAETEGNNEVGGELDPESDRTHNLKIYCLRP